MFDEPNAEKIRRQAIENYKREQDAKAQELYDLKNRSLIARGIKDQNGDWVEHTPSYLEELRKQLQRIEQ